MRVQRVLQLVVVAAIILVEVAGMVLIQRHDRHAGSSLIGLGIICLGPLLLWCRRTSED